MPSSMHLPELKFSLIRLFTHLSICLMAILFQASFTYAEGFKALDNGQTSALKTESFSTHNEFLPVTEAYKLTPQISDIDGNTKKLSLKWIIADNYYLYEERFKFRPSIELALTPSISPKGKPKFDEFAGKDMTLHYHEVSVEFVIPSTTPSFDLKITSQGCAEAGLCYPPYSENIRIDTQNNQIEKIENKPSRSVTNAQATPTVDNNLTSTEDQLWLWQALIFALLGGIILNLMPCVFPVLSIKALSLVQSEKHELKLHGLAYTLGIVLSFTAFAALLLVAKAGGEAVGWGFQLQSPGLVIALSYLFFIMGLSMTGFIQLGSSLMGAGQKLTEKSGLKGSFFTGVLAAVVASPCTAPFMGAALGFALTQPAYVCLAIFIALGLGMALPLLTLCLLPKFANNLPKPGLWMETLKEFFAFPLYISAIWLLWVLTNQAGSDTMLSTCIGAILLTFAIWIYGRPAAGLRNKIYKLFALIAILLAVFLPYQALKNWEKAKRWQTYSPQLLTELRTQGKPVFIDVTADWCITCKVNEHTSLTSPDVEAVFDELQVTTLKADWTNPNDEIKQLLQEYGRIGIPLYIWFPAGTAQKGVVLPQLLTPSIVVNALKQPK